MPWWHKKKKLIQSGLQMCLYASSELDSAFLATIIDYPTLIPSHSC